MSEVFNSGLKHFRRLLHSWDGISLNALHVRANLFYVCSMLSCFVFAYYMLITICDNQATVVSLTIYFIILYA